MVGDAGAWGKTLAAVDKCSGPSTGWRAGSGRAICHDPHSHSDGSKLQGALETQLGGQLWPGWNPKESALQGQG